MSDLRDYILSKLYEMAKAPKKKVEPKEPVKKEPVKTEPSHEDQEDFAKWQDEHNPMSNVQQEATDLRSYILNKASETLLEFDYRAVMAKLSKGVTGQGSAEGWDEPKRQAPVKPKRPPKPLASKYVGPKKPPVTEELKARIAHILADKIDEIINPSFKVDKEEVEARKTRGMKPFATTKKSTPSKEELMQVAAKAAKKPMPSITDVDVSQYLPKPPVKEWTERIIKILVEMKRPAHLQADKYKISGAAKLQGLPYINKLRADRGQRPHQRSPLANDPNMMKKSTALASVFSSQPLGPTEKAKVEADKAKEAADRPRVEDRLAKFDSDPQVAMIRRNNRRRNR